MKFPWRYERSCDNCGGLFHKRNAYSMGSAFYCSADCFIAGEMAKLNIKIGQIASLNAMVPAALPIPEEGVSDEEFEAYRASILQTNPTNSTR